jgi:hypothetical protein
VVECAEEVRGEVRYIEGIGRDDQIKRPRDDITYKVEMT